MQLTLAFLSGSSRGVYRIVLNGHGGSCIMRVKPDGKMLNGNFVHLCLLPALSFLLVHLHSDTG